MDLFIFTLVCGCIQVPATVNSQVSCYDWTTVLNIKMNSVSLSPKLVLRYFITSIKMKLSSNDLFSLPECLFLLLETPVSSHYLPSLKTLFNLSYLLKDPVYKCTHFVD